jgi:putative flippase GtrA
MVTPRFLKFIAVGAFNTLVTYALYLWLLRSMSYSLAYSISFAAGIVIALLLHARYVFKVGITPRKLLLYPLTYGVQYVFGLVVVTLAVRLLNIPERYALACSIMLSIPLMFWLTRRVLRDADPPGR